MDAHTWLAIAGFASVPIAWRLHHSQRYVASVTVLVLCAGLLRLSASLDPGLHPWDERYHALVAKKLIADPLKPTLYSDPDLPHVKGSWVAGHVWLNKPPLSLWAIAISLKFFGYVPWAVRLPSILLSMLATGLLFLLARERWTVGVAFWSALLFAINGHLIELASGRTSVDHPDAFLVCLVVCALFAASRMAVMRSFQWSLIAGSIMGLAFLSKSWPALIIAPVSFAFLFNGGGGADLRQKTYLFTLLLAAFFVVAAPWSVYSWSTYPDVARIASDLHWRHFTEGLEGHARPWHYYLTQLGMIHGELVAVAVLWFLLVRVRRAPLEKAGLLAWFVLPYLVFSLAITKMPGYTAIAAPAVFIIIGIAVENWSRMRYEQRALRIAIRVLVFALIFLPLRFSWDRVAPFREIPKRYNLSLLAGDQDHVVMEHPHPIEMMFHTEVAAAYGHTLSDSTIQRLTALGYVVKRADQ